MITRKRQDQTKLTLQRLALDDRVHEHLGDAIVQLREAWRRAAHRPPARAVEDKKLYARIRQAAISLARAVKLLGPEPEPPKHRGRKAAGLLLACGAGAVAMKRRRASASEPAAGPPATGPEAVPVAEPQPSAA